MIDGGSTLAKLARLRLSNRVFFVLPTSSELDLASPGGRLIADEKT